MIARLNNKGFTIIELLIATSVFASVLFIVTYGMIQISRMYTNGFIQTQTQNSAITIANGVIRDLQFTSNIGSSELRSGSYYYFCTSQNEYFYIPMGSLYQIPLSDIGDTCIDPNSINLSQAQNLLPPSSHMTILNHSTYDSSATTMLTGSGGLYTVDIYILYGNVSNLVKNLNTNQYDCKAIAITGPFCSIYNLRTVAYTQN